MMEQRRKLNSLEEAIFSTIAYFDIFSYPLTLIEIWKWLINAERTWNHTEPREATQNRAEKHSVSDIQNTLEKSLALNQLVKFKKGFYFLKGREGLVNQRLKRHNLAQPRFKKLRKFAKLVQAVPFVEMAAACNTLAIGDIKKESDLDVFIIVRRGRLWYTRFWVTFLTWISGMWRHREKISNRICLSFFLADDNLNLSPIAKKPYDIYLVYWISLLVPLFNRGVFKKFIKENSWVRDYLPHFEPCGSVAKRRLVPEIKFFKWWNSNIDEKIFAGKLGDLLEKVFRRVQLAKMKQRLKDLDKRSTDVIVSDKMLKFHEVDKREEFRRAFEARCGVVE